jgi:hypothetical protein
MSGRSGLARDSRDRNADEPESEYPLSRLRGNVGERCPDAVL